MNSSSQKNEVRERVYYVRANPDFAKDSDVFVMARSSFAWLLTGPDPVSVDGSHIPGLPSRPVPLDELGALLLAEDCTQATRDAAWAYLITRARSESGTWTVACVGLALPVLLRVAAIVTRRFTSDTHDLNAAVLTGFLQELREVDLVRPAILARLYWAAYREGHRALSEAAGSPIPTADLEFRSAPPQPDGHPDLVLAAAVKAGAITTEEAGLISETRLGETSLTEAAQARGRSYRATQKTRERAEARLVAYLAPDPEDTVDGQPDTAAENRAPRHRAPAAATVPSRTHRTRLRNVTRTSRASVKKARRSVSPNGPKSRIAPRGTHLPADHRPRAGRTTCGPAAHTVREVRSCD